MKISLIILELNEIEGMKIIMPRIKPEWVDQLIVVDGNSDDGTVEWARDNGYFVYTQKEKGIRAAYREVLPLITGDIVLTFSPDGNSIPEKIPAVIDKMREGYDMVIASRYLKPAKSHDDDMLTAFGNWFFTRTVNFLFHSNYTDVMVIFRAYKKSLIEDLDLNADRWYALPEKIFNCTLSWEPMLSARAARRKLRVVEIPVDEPERIGGVRKLKPWRWGASYYYQFFRDYLIWR